MRKISYVLGSMLMVWGGSAIASQPTDINYSSKGSTALGTEYSTYTVRCSDGAKREITAWDKRKKWCVGTSNHCTNDQLKTAKDACGAK
ncbi:MAG: hypothetical protein RL368_634 [Pseudomonadota bacterium]|jgi:hypothetical protein